MLKNAIMYFLSFKTYVVLPVIIFVLALVFRIKWSTALKSALTIGIGFVGIFLAFDFFVKIIEPVVRVLIIRSGLHLNVLDTGWPPLAAITWSFNLAPLLLVIFIAVNIVMLIFKLTKVVDIDIWNYWHVILAAVMMHQVTGNVYVTIAMAVLIFIITLKLAEWSAPLVNQFSGMHGVCLPHLSGGTYFPFALAANGLFDRIPGLNRMNAKPERIQQKLGLLGEPMVLGLIIGTALGISAGYDLKHLTELAMSFAAVIYILPKMCGILGSGLIPVSEGMKQFIQKNFPNMGETYIGLDVAVIFGEPSVVVSTLILIPVALLLAFVLPGINFIPLGDLTNLMVPLAFVCVATRGNVVRSLIIGIPVVIANLYIASGMTGFFTHMARTFHYQIAGYHGSFTSFLDGGQFFRAWLVGVLAGDLRAIIFIPIVLGFLYWTWKTTKTGQATQKSSRTALQ